MEDIMSDFFGKLKSGAGKVAFEAEKMNRLNRAKGELEQLKKQIDGNYMKLGELYYHQYQTMPVTGPAYEEFCQAIVSLEQQVASKNEDIQRINAETYGAPGAGQAVAPTAPANPIQFTPPAASTPTQPEPSPAQAAPATKFCPNCGREMAVTAKFCPDCGSKM
jgi:hypothetical protein